MSFISEIAPHAQRHAIESKVLASLIIAQAIHESNWGKSGLATQGKNLFGIKGTYGGQSVTMPTWEVYNGKSVKVNAAFRKYPTWYESIADLISLYKNGVSWDRDKYHKIIGETDYKKACKAVQSAGYATDPAYATKLIRIIEDNDLTQYDDGEDDETPSPKPAKPTSPKKETAAKSYKVVKSISAYKNAADAKNKKNKAGTVKAGTYTVFNESNGMVNVTKKSGTPGSWINPSENKVTSTASKSSAASSKIHIVKDGENLTKIASKYNTSVNKLITLNKIENQNLIYPGQKLKIK